MARIKLLTSVVASGGPQKAGAILEVADSEARFLIGARRAVEVEQSLEVVVTEVEEKPKRRGRPKKGAAEPAAAQIETLTEE